jgi:hypothetical protein
MKNSLASQWELLQVRCRDIAERFSTVKPVNHWCNIEGPKSRSAAAAQSEIVFSDDVLHKGCLMVVKFLRTECEAKVSPSQLTLDVWMSYWTVLSEDNKTLQLFSHGPHSTPLWTLNTSCVDLVVGPLTATNFPTHRLSLPFLTMSSMSGIHRGGVIKEKQAIPYKDVSLSVQFQTLFDLWCWTMSFASVTCRTIDASCFNVEKVLDEFGDSDLNAKKNLRSRISGMHLAASSTPTKGTGILANGEPKILLCSPVAGSIHHDGSSGLLQYATMVLNCLCEHHMIESGIRRLQVVGALVTSARFQNFNGRVIFTRRGDLSCSQIVEGSVLISVNQLMAVPSSAHICLKLLGDLPRSLPASLVFWRFPRFQAVVRCEAGPQQGESSHRETTRPSKVVSMVLKIENGGIELQPLLDLATRNSTSSESKTDVLTVSNPLTDLGASECTSLRISECQFHLILNQHCQGPFGLAIRIVGVKSAITVSHAELPMFLQIWIHVIMAAKLMGAVPVDLGRLSTLAEARIKSEQKAAVERDIQERVDEFVGSQPLRFAKSISLPVAVENSGSEEQILLEDEDTYEDERLISPATGMGAEDQENSGSLGPRNDGFELLETAEMLKQEMLTLTIAPQRAFPSMHCVKEAVNGIRKLNMRNHELITRMMSLEVAPAVPPTVVAGPPGGSLSASVQPGSGNNVASASLVSPNEGGILMTPASEVGYIRSSLDALPPSMTVAGSGNPTSVLETSARGGGVGSQQQLQILSHRELIHCSKIVMYMRANPRSVLSMARAANDEERLELAHVLVSRLYSMWSSDDTHLQRLVVLALTDGESNFSSSGFSPGRYHQQSYTHNPVPGLPQFSSLLLSQILHRIDVVVSVKALCDSLEDTSIWTPGSTTAMTEITTATEDVSELCRKFVEPFCTKMLDFITRKSFPYVIACTMHSLSSTCSVGGLVGRNVLERKPQLGPESRFLTPADFLCSCIGKGFTL